MKITINVSPAKNFSQIKMQPTSFWFVIVCIYVFAWISQSQSILNSDVSWMILASQRMWKGGSYSQNFFEINPPMILQLYSPIVLLKMVFNSDIALRIYIFGIASISLLLCFDLFKKMAASSHDFPKYIFIFVLAGLFLILPQNDFGQREHLMLIMVMPYFLLAVCRAENETFTSRKLLILIGLLAGFGFAIKPYFFISFALVEVFLMYRSRRAFYGMRTEVMAIAAVLIFYAFTLLTVYRDYLTVVMPLITQFYYQKFSLPLNMLLTSDQAFFYYFAAVFYLIRYKENTYQSLSTILMLAATGFYISFLIQGTLWPYHTLPLFAFNILLFSVLFYQLVMQPYFTLKDFIVTGLYGLTFFLYLMLKINYMQMSILFYPIAYFCLFAAIFSLLLSAATPNNFAKNIAKVGLIIFIAVIFYENATASYLHAHVFLLTSLLLILSFWFLLTRAPADSRFRFGILTLLGLIIFSLPFHQMGYVFTYTAVYKKQYANLTRMIEQYPKQSVFFLSNACELTFPALDYTKRDLATRFGCLGWLPHMNGQAIDYKKIYAESEGKYSFFINAVVEDLEKYKPDLIFVDMRNMDSRQPKRYFGSQQMDYLKFFSQNSAFVEIMKKYRYVKTADGQPLYKLDIYQKRGDA